MCLYYGKLRIMNVLTISRSVLRVLGNFSKHVSIYHCPTLYAFHSDNRIHGKQKFTNEGNTLPLRRGRVY